MSAVILARGNHLKIWSLQVRFGSVLLDPAPGDFVLVIPLDSGHLSESYILLTLMLFGKSDPRISPFTPSFTCGNPTVQSVDKIILKYFELFVLNLVETLN